MPKKWAKKSSGPLPGKEVLEPFWEKMGPLIIKGPPFKGCRNGNKAKKCETK